MKCDRCKIEIDKNNCVETEYGYTYCFGCDSKRLEDFEGYFKTNEESWK